jgi:Uncharacterized protein conserved in bacteria
MISRIWHGWTTPANADRYHEIVTRQVIPAIIARALPGFRRIELLRREAGEEVEFATIMWFDTLDDIRAFTGEDYETAHVPAAARAVLSRFDERSAHYRVLLQAGP